MLVSIMQSSQTNLRRFLNLFVLFAWEPRSHESGNALDELGYHKLSNPNSIILSSSGFIALIW